MASNIAIVSAATLYNFHQSGGMMGVTLSGRLGALTVWSNGQVDTPRPCDLVGYTDPSYLGTAQEDARRYLSAGVA